jgi:hypothetical protein
VGYLGDGKEALSMKYAAVTIDESHRQI